MTFEESGRRFVFRAPWLARAYDRHTYFQGLSSAGLKGVDFIALHPRRGYLLMEVKNFRDQPPPPPADLARELLRKTSDTLDGVHAIGNYLQRAWHRRMLGPLWMRWPAGRSDRAFWTQLHRLVQDQPPEALLFWLEGQQVDPHWRRAVLHQLYAQYPEGPFQLAFPGHQPLAEVVSGS